MMKNSSCLKLRRKTVAVPLAAFIIFLFFNYSHAAERKSITITPNDSVSLLCFKVYDRYSPEMVKHLSKINPHIEDWENLPAGKEILFLTEKEMESLAPGGTENAS